MNFNMMPLNAENYKSGFLVDDEAIAGIAVLGTEGAQAPSDGNSSPPSLYAAYVSHYLTGETIAYAEFDQLEPALNYLGAFPRNWVFEAVGCTKKSGAASSCGGAAGSCASGGGCGS